MSLAPLALVLAVFPAQVKPWPVPAAGQPPTAAPAPSPGDGGTLKAAFLPDSGPGLLDFLRKRTPPGPDKDRVAELVGKLGDKDAAVREKAARELVCIGMPAVAPLRRLANALDNAEPAEVARKCLAAIEGHNAAGVTMSVLRMVAAQKPDGAAEALLAFLPFAEDDRVVQEALDALAAVGRKENGPDPVLVKALQDPVPCRRAAAAEVLCRIDPAAARSVRPLLNDPRPTVRFHAALALLRAYDGEAVQVLIDSLADLQPPERKRAEDYLTELAGDWAVAAPKGNDSVSRQLRREVWSAWWRGTDGSKLLDELRQRTPTDEEREKALGLIRQLGSESAEARDRAAAELVAMGPRAVAPLRRAADGGAWSGDHAQTGVGDQAAGATDPAAAVRIAPAAAKCLELIEKDAPNPLPTAAIRLLGLRRPAGAVDALLGYLPFAESEETLNLLREVLASAGVRDGKADPALVQALDSPVGIRRAAAALALCKGGAADQLPAVRKLLKDADPDVRRWAGLSLAGLGEKDAVPVLIDLLADLPVQDAWEVEGYLTRVAGDKAPAAQLAADKEARAKARDAWAAWWKENGDKVRLPGPDEARYLGYLLVVETWDPTRGRGRVLELNAAGKIRWQIDKDLQQPFDAQLLPGERVLMVEHNQGVWRVTERDLTGKVLWEKPCANPFQVQRLRNGNTFIACRNQLLEVDRGGKEVLNIARFNEYLMSARKFADGQIALLNNQGQYTRLDAAGKEAKTFRVPFELRWGLTGAEVLPGDRVLISQNTGNGGKVAEYNADGKVVWEAAIAQAGAPHRLPNGHTLVAHGTGTMIVEFDRQGKVFKEYKNLPCRAYRVYGR
jgi:HEAT repeat protein